jgi:hypothetical protein
LWRCCFRGWACGSLIYKRRQLRACLLQIRDLRVEADEGEAKQLRRIISPGCRH